MPSSKMLFIVPQDSGRLAEILSDHGGYLEFERDLDDFREFLSAHVGQPLTAEFEDLDDPSEALREFAQELDARKAPYFGACDSYEERSRGDRFEGYVVYNIGNGLVQSNHPWRDGDPDLDERSLAIAGVSQEEIGKIADILLSPPFHRPR